MPSLLIALACTDDEGNVLVQASPTPASTSSVAATSISTRAPATVTPAVTPSATPTVLPTPPGSDLWSATSVFDPTSAAPDAWQSACGVPVYALAPGSIDCVETIMREMGAAQSAIDFLKQQGYLLQSFEERGAVDYGRGSAPWFNMARPTQQLFLNGEPDVIEVGAIPEGWNTQPRYAAVVASNPNAYPWTEYGRLTVMRASGGVLSFEIAYPLQDCRVCRPVGFVVMAYDFNAQGRLTAERLLPFVAN